MHDVYCRPAVHINEHFAIILRRRHVDLLSVTVKEFFKNCPTLLTYPPEYTAYFFEPPCSSRRRHVDLLTLIEYLYYSPWRLLRTLLSPSLTVVRRLFHQLGLWRKHCED